MDPIPHDRVLAAVDAATRRLLLRVIDLRFALEDAAEALRMDAGGFAPGDLHALRSDADGICHAIEDLADVLRPPGADGDEGVEETSLAFSRPLSATGSSLDDH